MDTPRISCIMPTRNRRRFIRQALKYFQWQDYPNKELLLLDDGEECVCDLVPEESDIRSISISERCTIGMKRNLACSLATGEIICHMDDDDYYGPHRLSLQAEPLLQGQADVSAMRMSLLFESATHTLWTCSDDTHRKVFKQDVHYGTIMYRASFWQQGTSFASVNVGEDVRFVHALLARGARLARIVDPASYIYVLHGSNTTSDMRLVHPDGWSEVPMDAYLSEGERMFYRTV